jgi:hypothetical protein
MALRFQFRRSFHETVKNRFSSEVLQCSILPSIMAPPRVSHLAVRLAALDH